MYKCNNCGHFFEIEDIYNWTEPHGEKMAGCPVCHCDFSVVHSCKKCGKVVDHLYGCQCEDCLRDSIRLDLFRAFISCHKEELKAFMFEVVFECSEPPKGGNEELSDFLDRVYTRKVYEDALGGKNDFAEKCKDYVMHDKTYAEAFSIWLRKRGVS